MWKVLIVWETIRLGVTEDFGRWPSTMGHLSGTSCDVGLTLLQEKSPLDSRMMRGM